MTVEVTPRKGAPWKLPLGSNIYKDNWAYDPGWAPPEITAVGGQQVYSAQLGENLCALDHLDVSRGLFHPHSQGGSWLDRGYSLEQVSDSGGPFDGWFYVSDTSLELKREGVCNKWIHPNAPPTSGAPQSLAQKNKGVWASLIGAITKHKGWGGAVKRSGHTQLFVEVLKKDDPRKEIEALFDTDRVNAHIRIDDRIAKIERKASEHSDDPLTCTWTGSYSVWNPITNGWEVVRFTCQE